MKKKYTTQEARTIVWLGCAEEYEYNLGRPDDGRLFHHVYTKRDYDGYESADVIYTIIDLDSGKPYKTYYNSSNISYANAKFDKVQDFYSTLDSKLSKFEKVKMIHKEFGKKDVCYIKGYKVDPILFSV